MCKLSKMVNEALFLEGMAHIYYGHFDMGAKYWNQYLAKKAEIKERYSVDLKETQWN